MESGSYPRIPAVFVIEHSSEAGFYAITFPLATTHSASIAFGRGFAAFGRALLMAAS